MIDEQYIRSIIEKVLAERQGESPDCAIELTPKPSRRNPRRYIRTTLTIDEQLWQMIQTECDRLNILPPKMIDSLIWNYFGKPKLSYEKEKSSG